MREGSFDLRAIAQGSIGDCYYLASLMAVMNSPEGQALLADGIRPHYNQDGTIDGYIVTVYDKPGFFSSGSSTEVLVRDTYANGARSSGSAGVISLYEKAFSQLHPGGVNRSTFFESGITAGYPREALPRVTGQGTSTVDRDGIFGFGSGYDAGEQQTIIEAANSGQPTIANTENSDAFTNRTAPVDVTLAQRAGDAHRHLPRTRLRGHTRRFVRPHARQSARYQHGLGDGKRDPTGEFTISWENFNKYYGDVTLVPSNNAAPRAGTLFSPESVAAPPALPPRHDRQNMTHQDRRWIIPGHAVRCGLIDGFGEPAMSVLRSEITDGIPRVTLAVTWRPGAGTPPPGMRAELAQGESASLSNVGSFTLVDMEAPLDGDMFPPAGHSLRTRSAPHRDARRYAGANGLFFPDTIDDGSHS